MNSRYCIPFLAFICLVLAVMPLIAVNRSGNGYLPESSGGTDILAEASSGGGSSGGGNETEGFIEMDSPVYVGYQQWYNKLIVAKPVYQLQDDKYYMGLWTIGPVMPAEGEGYIGVGGGCMSHDMAYFCVISGIPIGEYQTHVNYELVEFDPAAGTRTVVETNVQPADVCILRADFVVPDSLGGRGTAEHIFVSSPRPVVELDEVKEKGGVVIGKDFAAVNISGYVKDAIADNVPDNLADIEQVQIYVDGQPYGLPVSLNSLKDQTEKSFWKQDPYKGQMRAARVQFEPTIGTHAIRVETSENAAGLKGWDEVKITLKEKFWGKSLKVDKVENLPGSTEGAYNPFTLREEGCVSTLENLAVKFMNSTNSLDEISDTDGEVYMSHGGKQSSPVVGVLVNDPDDFSNVRVIYYDAGSGELRKESQPASEKLKAFVWEKDAEGALKREVVGAEVEVLRARLIPDFNHDRKIDSEDEGQANVSNPFRFWINDDDDFGDISEDDSDVPGQGGLFDNANCDDDEVNGHSDLLDFFPVWLDLHDTLDLLPTADGAEYKLSHADEALQFVYTDLTRAQAGNYLTTEGSTYGPSFNQDAFEADTIEVSSSGVTLNTDFLDKIVADENKGILMMEVVEVSTSPLVLEIWKDGNKICETELPIKLSSVQDMYRWINVRGAANGSVTDSTDTSEPDNFPDSFSNGKNFIFVHGYSVHEEGARAWASEMFKRLYQSGSRAKFTAATWYGNEGQVSDWIPFIGGSTPDYYANVENAFQTAGTLELVISGSSDLSGTKYIAGHSLGNMVVSSAIKDHGLSVNTYFMLNAAVAMEAYDPEANHRDDIRHPNWQSYTNHNLWASDWHKLFASPPGDSRNKLSWKNYFGTMSNGRNYFSSTEDVLDNANGNVPSLGKEQAWVNQEMRKGTTLIWLGPGNAEAGWGFNSDYDVITGYDPQTGLPIYGRMPPAQANALQESTLKANSFFLHFDDEELYDSATGSAFLLDGHSDVRDSDIYRRLLADAIPALSNPAGRNPLGNAVQADVDYMSHRRGAYPSGWPRNDDRWWHSDIKNVAYPYNRSIFDKIVTDGSLK